MLSAFGTSSATQGELAVGNAWVHLSATSLPCQRVFLAAPTSNHPKGSANTTNILVAISVTQPSDAAGCRTIPSDGSRDQYIHVTDAKLVWLRGFTAGDVIEYSIEGSAQNQI